MRSSILRLLVLLLVCSTSALAKITPLGVKDVSLMLRTGYSAADVEQELARRYFMETVDGAAEQTLLKSGATPQLIASLKSGRFAIPASALADAQREVEEQARRKALQAEGAKNLNTLHQAQLAEQRAAAAKVAAASTTAAHALAPHFRGSLVSSTNGALSLVNDEPLAKKKLIALYFSAYWCGPCRKFTPELVQFYHRVAAAHPELEIVFISNDRSASAMEKYMRDMQMPWPAIAFDKIKEKTALLQYAGSGIPCLVLVDAQGQVVSHSYDGKNYLGPNKVLADLDRMFNNSAAAPVARR